MRKTKIVCTIGPATDSEKGVKELAIAGMNVARVNMSHGTNSEHIETITKIKKVRETLGKSIGIMVDLKGPEVRIGKFENGQVDLKDGQKFTLDTKSAVGNATRVGVSTNELFAKMQKGQRLLLSDGTIELVAEEIQNTSAICKVKSGGVLGSNKSINAPGLNLNLPFLSEVDKIDMLMAISQGTEFVALSFVESKENVEAARKFLNKNGGADIKLIAKIESANGVKNMEQIIEAADGVMVARGDLAVEVDFFRLPHIQNQMLAMAKSKHKISITATQMLVSMVSVTRPTRAEVTDIANAVLFGSGAVMLSEETAVGTHPALCVKTMAKIASECEKHLKSNPLPTKKVATTFESVCLGAVSASARSKIKNIVVVTGGGKTACEIAAYRPNANVVALTPHEQTFNQMSILFGVEAYEIPIASNSEKLWAVAKQKLLNEKLVNSGEQIIYLSGDPQKNENNQMEIRKI